MHTAKKKRENYKKGKFRYNDQFVETAAQTPQHQKFKFSKSDASKKRNKAQAPSSLDHRSQVFTLKKVLALKTMPSTRSLADTGS
jgi:hypothetical protein